MVSGWGAAGVENQFKSTPTAKGPFGDRLGVFLRVPQAEIAAWGGRPIPSRKAKRMLHIEPIFVRWTPKCSRI